MGHRTSPASVHRPAALPLYERVYEDLLRRLDDGEWKPGDQLPIETDIMQQYACSSITVRRALGDLVREGRIERRRGKGTFALGPRIERDLGMLTSFTEEMYHRGLDPKTRLISAQEFPADRQIAEALNISIEDPVYMIERLRMANAQPILLEQVYLSVARFPTLLTSDLSKESLYSILTGRFSVRFGRAIEVIEPVMLSVGEAGLLEQSQNKPALKIHLTTYDQGDRPVEFCRSLVRGGSTKYKIALTGLSTFEHVPVSSN